MLDPHFFEDSAVKTFIKDNLEVDVHKLMLNPPSFLGENVRVVVDQLLARRKAKRKLPSLYRNFDLLMPPPLSIEQASSEVTANYKSGLFSGKHLIDLTGGTGIDCLALSGPFERTTYVEQSEEIASVFAYNVGVLKKNVQVINEDAISFLSKNFFDSDACFFIDPARRKEGNKVFQLVDCEPNLTEVLDLIPKKRVLIKLSPLIDIKSVLHQMPSATSIHVVAVRNETKEVLVMVDGNQHVSSPKIMAVNLETTQKNYQFTYQEEKSSASKPGSPMKYLYEPNGAILKAGAFKKVGQDFGLSKLDVNTHMYTSDEIRPEFPGKIMEIVAHDISKHNLRQYAPDNTINVITRNYVMNTSELKRKYKLKDGGNYYLIGFKAKGKKHLVICQTIDPALVV